MKKQNFRWLVGVVLTATLACVPSGRMLAQTFDYVGLGGNQSDWNEAGNWFDFVGGAPGIPNGAGIIATIPSPPPAGANPPPLAGLDIGSPIVLTTLNMNVGTTIGGMGSLTVTNLNAPDAVNASTINVDLLLANVGTSSGMTVTSATSMVFNGDVALTGAQTIRNSSGTNSMTFNGSISNSGGTLTLRNDNAAAQIHLNGSISGGSGVTYAGGIFHNNVANSYTGTTLIGVNSPNIVSTNILANDDVFGTGRLQFGGGTAIKTLEGRAGNGTRTLANELQLQREARFAGTESFVLAGNIFQSNSRSIINDISGAGKDLTITGQVAAANSADGRLFGFSGSGTTVLKSAVWDRYDAGATPNTGTFSSPNQFGGLRYNGTGTLILDNGFIANYTGGTEILSGSVRLGTGGAAVGLNNHAISGSTTGTGTLVIDHSGSLAMSNPISGALNIQHVGSGTTSLDSSSFGTGTISVSNGKLLINGGVVAGQTGTGTRPVSNQVRIDTSAANGLLIGQPLTVSGSNNNTPFSNELYILSKTVDGGDPTKTLVLLSGNVSNSANNADPSLNNVWNFNAPPGTGTGARNVVANGGTVGGDGVLGGNLSSNSAGAFTSLGTIAPGNSIGTLSVVGNANLNGLLDIEYDGSAFQATDILEVLGNMVLGANSTVQFSQLGASLTGPSYIFASYDGSLSGTFGNVVDMPVGYQIDYAFNGNSIALVVVPEPSSMLLLTGGLFGLMKFRRRQSAG